MSRETPPPITPLEFDPDDFERAERIARRLGYKQTAYTSTSALWGLFCLPENPAERPALTLCGPGARQWLPPYRHGCVIKTREFGLMFVQTAEDLGFEAGS